MRKSLYLDYFLPIESENLVQKYIKNRELMQFKLLTMTRYQSFRIFLRPEWQKQPSRAVLGKGVLKICSKFTGENPCRSVISIKLQSNVTEITLRHGCSPVNLLHFFRTSFPKNASKGLLLKWFFSWQKHIALLKTMSAWDILKH